MKYPVLILALLLSSALCQELIIDSITTSYNSGTAFTKTYQYSQWNNVLDFAIYGWFKISSSYPKNEWATGFHFTSNQGSNWTNASKNGDRVLAFWTINDQLHNPTYSIANGNTNNYNNCAYQSADLDKWAFIYLTHGSAQSAQFVYFKLGSSGEQTKKLTSITHAVSSFYQIAVAQSFTYKYWPGSFWRLSIIGGPNAYRESGFDVFQTIKPDAAPACPVVFTGCAQSGTATNVCQNIPVFNVKTIQSVYIPSGYTLTVYDTNNYAGKKITYNQSIECITSFNWAMLVNTNAITVEDDDRTALRKSSKKSKRRN